MSIGSTELVIYINNTSELYPQYKACIANLCRKIARGNYDHNRAADLFVYLAEAGAKSYAREFDDVKRWAQIFTPAIRREAAARLRDKFEAEYRANAYDGINPVAPDKRAAI